MTTSPKPEQLSLNTEMKEGRAPDVEREEREVGSLGTAQSPSTEKSPAEEMTEKLKKPTIGAGLVVLLIINSIQFFVGVTTTKDCPAKNIIPIYLAVAGAVGIITKVMPILNRNRRLRVVDIILTILGVFEFIWMILGSVWIYGIYEPNYDILRNPTNYCNKTAYLLAFWLLTLYYIALILLITIPCCLICAACCCAICVAAVED